MAVRVGMLEGCRAVLVAAALLFMPAAIAVEQEPSAARLMDDLMWNRRPIGGPFTLTDHTGKPRSDSEFRGKLTELRALSRS